MDLEEIERLAAQRTSPPQIGIWTLTAPDGRTWKAATPILCVSTEQRERIPSAVGAARILQLLAIDEEDNQ